MKNKAISNLLNIGSSLLKKSTSARLDAQLLLCACLRYDKIQLTTRPDVLIPNNIINKFYFLIGQRSINTPLAYLLKMKEFYGLTFQISNTVLVPRPETETMIDIGLDYIKGKKGSIKIIDLGTGSGCIAISLADTLLKLKDKTFKIDAIDKTPAAVKLARQNSKKLLGAKHHLVNIFQLDYLQKNLPGSYDLILANPPYLNLEEYQGMKGTPVYFEPKIALYGAKDGLKYYKRINILLGKHLKSDGIAIIEIGQQTKQQISRIFKHSFKVEFKRDLSGNTRFIIISHQ